MPPPKPNKRYALYIRVATDSDEAMLAIAEQADAADKWAPDDEAHIVARYVDIAASGMSENRPAFQRMIQDAVNPDRPFDAILVQNYGRFTRSIALYTKYSRKLDQFCIPIVSIDQPEFDRKCAKLFETIFDCFDEYYREQLRRALKERKGEPPQPSQ